MSETNLPEIKEPTTDLCQADMDAISKFVEEGKMALALVDETRLHRIMDLYLSGKTYTQIAKIMRMERVPITYLSHKFGWYATKMQYLQELDTHMRQRIIESKIVSQDFLLTLTQAWQKKIGNKVQAYLRTDDDTHTDAINLKEVAQYLKTMDMLHKLNEDPTAKSAKAPAVGLNLGDGVTVTKLNDNSVEITPKQKTLGEMLKQIADARREDDARKATIKASDIKKDQPSEGEQDEEDE